MPTVLDRDLALIRDPELITPSWLTAVLRAEGTLPPGGEVVELTSTLTGEGVGILSRIYRVVPVYNDVVVDAPATLIVKIATENEASRFTADLLSAFKRELLFYTEFARTVPFSTPRCFAAAQAEDNTDFTLVMEDLGGCRFQDQLNGSTWEDTIAAIRAIASFHAAWMGKDLPYPDLYLPLDSDIYRVMMPMLFDQNWGVAQEVFADLVTPEIKAFGDVWGTHIDFLMTASDSPSRTLLHGDWRADNVVFDRDDGSVIGIDFQLVGAGIGTFDVAYYVSQSVNAEERAGRDAELIETYVDALKSHGIDADFDTAWHEYRMSLLSCLIYPVSTATGYDVLPERGKDLVRSMFARASTAIVDTNALELLPSQG